MKKLPINTYLKLLRFASADFNNIFTIFDILKMHILNFIGFDPVPTEKFG